MTPLSRALFVPRLRRTTVSAAAASFSSSSSSASPSSPSSTSKSDDYDVVVVGGGVVGTALACRLAQIPSLDRYRVAVIESAAPKPSGDVKPDVPDLRVYALSPASKGLLSKIGVWSDLAARAPPYAAMQVWDHHGPGHITFSATDCGVPELGFVAEHNYLQALLYERVRELETLRGVKNLRVLCPGSVVSVKGEDANSTSGNELGADEEESQSSSDWVSLKMDDGSLIRSRLVIAADGAASPTRGRMGFGMYGVDYPQRAVVCTVKCEGGAPGAQDIALQRFLANGPLAVLPLWNGYASIVWSTTPEHAALLQAASEHEFNAELNDALHAAPLATSSPGVGAAAAGAAAGVVESAAAAAGRVIDGIHTLPPFAGVNGSMAAALADVGGGGGDASFCEPPRLEVCSFRASFPLRLAQATSFTKHRIALVGDAAHTVHPMAGQGLNLGLADVESLCDALDYAASTGQDLGSPTTLANYDRERRAVNAGMGLSLDGLKRLFDASAAPVAWARSTGLSALNANRALKRRIASVAMGL